MLMVRMLMLMLMLMMMMMMIVMRGIWSATWQHAAKSLKERPESTLDKTNVKDRAGNLLDKIVQKCVYWKYILT